MIMQVSYIARPGSDYSAANYILESLATPQSPVRAVTDWGDTGQTALVVDVESNQLAVAAQVNVLADAALENFAHAWQALIMAGVVHISDQAAFPPEVSDQAGSAGYHLAAVARYLKEILAASGGEA